ncbi:MAG: SDR family oxidoreductase [Pseudomonadota bacterium]|nr:SDR family oxidoreductase [Pseudomonadota bacterium]
MNVLLTGAAGLLGGAIAQQLVRAGHDVIGLVHSATDIRGNDGSSVSSVDYGAERAGHVQVLKGDVSAPDLALDAECLADLSARIDCVIHCAALVKFEADYQELAAVNVDGTRHVAAAFPDARFVHVSTAYSCGIANGPVPEQPHSCEGPFANGYERSKAMAEAQLRLIRPDAIIARPSIILGEFGSGTIRSFDTIYRAFKFIAEGYVNAVPVAPDATLNFVPIDHVVAGIVALAEAEEPADIVHLAAQTAFCARRFLELIGSFEGLRCPRILPVGDEPAGKSRLAARSVAPYLSYFSRNPEFETDGFSQLTGRPSPDMDEDAMLRQIRFCIDAGFIRPR